MVDTLESEIERFGQRGRHVTPIILRDGVFKDIFPLFYYIYVNEVTQ